MAKFYFDDIYNWLFLKAFAELTSGTPKILSWLVCNELKISS